jgi:hypothetical protein
MPWDPLTSIVPKEVASLESSEKYKDNGTVGISSPVNVATLILLMKNLISPDSHEIRKS